MLGWLKRRRFEKSRAIFHFYDGQRTRGVDPLATLRAMQLHPVFAPDKHLPLCDDGDPEAIGVTVAAAREIFQLPAFEQGGMTESEVLGVVMGFSAYLEALKKNGNTSLT